ncbi:MAG: hypothetical protein ACJ8AD_08170 [Gemmatimonadaceae bacterium]
MKRRLLLFVGLGLFLVERPAAAQAGSDRESLEVAVARLVRESLPKGRFALLRPREAAQARTPAHTRALLDAFDGRDVIDAVPESVVRCGDPAGGCHLEGVDGTISIRVDSVAGDEAEVDVLLERAERSSPRISYVGTTWSASRVGGVWKIGAAKWVRRS